MNTEDRLKMVDTVLTEGLAIEHKEIKNKIRELETRLDEIRTLLLPICLKDGRKETKEGKRGMIETIRLKAGNFYLEVTKSLKELFSKDKFFELLKELFEDPGQLTFLSDEQRVSIFFAIKTTKEEATTTTTDTKFSVK